MQGRDLLGHTPTPARRAGRPKGAKNRRTSDLREYIAARFDGLTPGQQLAQAFMVTDRERRAAGGDMLKALTTKAKALAEDLGCKTPEAFAMIVAGQKELMGYIHPRLASLDLTSKGEKMGAAVVIVGDAPGLAGGGLAGGDEGLIDLDHSQYGISAEDQPLSLPPAGQVAPSKSHD